MRVIENYIKNVDEIITLLEQHADHFKKRDGCFNHGNHMGMESQFKTLHNVDMSEELLEAITKNLQGDLKDVWEFIQVQKYEIGDYIVPHKDAYDVLAIHLFHLTSSDCDGTTTATEDGKGLVTIMDKAGQKVEFPYTAWHWVNPVISHTRYTLVIGE